MSRVRTHALGLPNRKVITLAEWEVVKEEEVEEERGKSGRRR